MSFVWDGETRSAFDIETGVRLKPTRMGPDNPSFVLSRGELHAILDLYPLIENQYDPEHDGYAWRYKASMSGNGLAIFEVSTQAEAKSALESALTTYLMSGNPKDRHFAIISFGSRDALT